MGKLFIISSSRDEWISFWRLNIVAPNVHEKEFQLGRSQKTGLLLEQSQTSPFITLMSGQCAPLQRDGGTHLLQDSDQGTRQQR